MSARTMRLLFWLVWLMLALITVAGPVWAQGDGGTNTPTNEAQVVPGSLDISRSG